jgi:hypothetical protein
MRGEPSPAVITAKSMSTNHANREIVLATGDKAMLSPVSASIIDAVTSRIQDPKPPMWHNSDKDVDEPNYSHPDYVQAIEDTNRRRGMAALDAMVMFGVELVDGLPENDKWLKKLQLMVRHGTLSLDGYDLDDELDREYLYKRFIAVDNDTINKISEISGISSAEVASAEAAFPG